MAHPLHYMKRGRNINRQGEVITKVLVVDDNFLLASLLQVMLEDEGFETRAAKDGQDGYSSYLLFRPDVVITDLHMPKANGMELMEHIRRHNPTVKTIYMSGDLLPFAPLLREEKGRYPVSVLPKPFSKEELLTLLSGRGDAKAVCLPSVRKEQKAGRNPKNEDRS